MSLGHVGLPVGPSQYKAMRDFYFATLTPLGYKVYLEEDSFFGMRGSNGPDFWLHRGGEDPPAADPKEAADGKKPAPMAHIAFAVTKAAHVDLWFQHAV